MPQRRLVFSNVVIVLNLCCASRHRFEGWFASNDDYAQQSAENRVVCPVCGDHEITRLPSSPRVKRSLRTDGKQQAMQARGEDAEQVALRTMLEVMQRIVGASEDVGERFPEEARRIHYEEVPARSIRGLATREETADLLEEGIAVVLLPIFPRRDMH